MSTFANRASTGALIMLAAFAAAPAQAALGGDVASVLRDGTALRASHAVTPFAAYDLHEATGADGTVLREYVDRSGKVFALSWRGPASPDVRALLGAHAKHYEAVRSRFSNHKVVNIDEPGFVVSIVKLPRGWSGQAVLPAAIPAGVARNELR